MCNKPLVQGFMSKMRKENPAPKWSEMNCLQIVGSRGLDTPSKLIGETMVTWTADDHFGLMNELSKKLQNRNINWPPHLAALVKEFADANNLLVSEKNLSGYKQKPNVRLDKIIKSKDINCPITRELIQYLLEKSG